MVSGWPPGRDRDVRKYVRPGEETALIRPRRFDADLLVVVHSAPGFARRRDAIRASWASPAELRRAGGRARVVFVMGGAGLPDGTLERLRAESDRNGGGSGDMLVEDFVDSYANVTLDTMSAAKFVVEGGTRKPEFVMFVDDDSYVDLPGICRALFGAKKEGKQHLVHT